MIKSKTVEWTERQLLGAATKATLETAGERFVGRSPDLHTIAVELAQDVVIEVEDA